VKKQTLENGFESGQDSNKSPPKKHGKEEEEENSEQ